MFIYISNFIYIISCSYTNNKYDGITMKIFNYNISINISKDKGYWHNYKVNVRLAFRNKTNRLPSLFNFISNKKYSVKFKLNPSS